MFSSLVQEWDSAVDTLLNRANAVADLMDRTIAAQQAIASTASDTALVSYEQELHPLTC
jgi:hypothetical protein